MRSPDRETVVRLRHQLQTCESTQRQAWRALGTLQEHLIAAGQTLPIQALTELLGELSTIRLLLKGVRRGEGGA